jgi:hypothetical protein
VHLSRQHEVAAWGSHPIAVGASAETLETPVLRFGMSIEAPSTLVEAIATTSSSIRPPPKPGYGLLKPPRKASAWPAPRGALVGYPR